MWKYIKADVYTVITYFYETQLTLDLLPLTCNIYHVCFEYVKREKLYMIYGENKVVWIKCNLYILP